MKDCLGGEKMTLKEVIQKNGGKKEFYVPLIFGAWLLYQFIDSFFLNEGNFDSLGSGGYARIVSGCGLVLIVLYLIRKICAIVYDYKHQAESSSELSAHLKQEKQEKTEPKTGIIEWARVHYEISMLILCVLYVFLIGQIGFIISSALYLLASMILYSRKENRSMKLIILLAVIFSFGVYYVFRYGFHIILP